MRAAASSMASGRPSRRAQIVATATALVGSSSKSSLMARARCVKSATAAYRPRSSCGVIRARSGTASGGTANACSARRRSGARLATSSLRCGQTASRLANAGAASSTCSILSSTSRSRRLCSAISSVSAIVWAPVSRRPRVCAMVGSTWLGVAYRRQRHEGHVVGKVCPERLGNLESQASLANTRRASERQQAHVLPAEQMDEGGFLALAPDERRRRDAGGSARWVGAGVAAARLSCACGRRAAATNVARSASASWRISASRATVSRCGQRVTPRSMSLMLRTLTLALSASSACVHPAAMRCRRSIAPNVAG